MTNMGVPGEGPQKPVEPPPTGQHPAPARTTAQCWFPRSREDQPRPLGRDAGSGCRGTSLASTHMAPSPAASWGLRGGETCVPIAVPCSYAAPAVYRNSARHA